MSHSEMLIRLLYFGFERPRDPGENESPMLSHSTHEEGRNFNQRSGEHVRDDKRPVAIQNIGTSKDELQPVREVIQERILRSDFQRIGVDIQANSLRHAHHQRRQCQNARSRAHVEYAIETLDT